MALKITPEQLQEIAATSFGPVYTSAMSSTVIRVAVGGAVSLIAVRLGITMDDAATQGWVDTILSIVVLASVIIARVKSKGASITTLQQAVADYAPMLRSAEPPVRKQLLQLVEERNPKLHAAIITQFPDLVSGLPPDGPKN